MISTKFYIGNKRTKKYMKFAEDTLGKRFICNEGLLLNMMIEGGLRAGDDLILFSEDDDMFYEVVSEGSHWGRFKG